MTYIDRAVDAMTRELPDQDPDLIRLYTLLALVAGVNTSRRDVHDAWAVWRSVTLPQHPAIVPFGDLHPDTQDLDQPYVDAIVRVARELAAPEVSP